MNSFVVFDGVCKLCVGSVQFILRNEVGPDLQFVPLQSTTGARMMRELGFDPDDARTFVVVENGKAYTRSGAAIRIARYLRWPWRALAIVRILPRPLRDWAYDLVATHRYQWFGRNDRCMLPTPELSRRFVQD